MKILLLGKNGQVGWELQRSLAPLGELIALDRHSSEFCGDLANQAGLADTVRTVRPDVIVNAAAYTAVDKAESEPELASAINAHAPEVLAREAAELGAWLVHYSTDYVFGGGGDRPWCEDDPTFPLNVYGQTKLLGEHMIDWVCPRHLIFRTSWVYAARGGNFAKTMLRLAQERDQLKVINDQFGAPTGAELIADVTAHAIRQVTQAGADTQTLAGIYHLVASGCTSWFDYAQYVIAQARKLQPGLAIKSTVVEPVPTSAFPTPAQRPLNSRLDTRKLQETFGLSLPEWQLGVDRMLAETITAK
ncbi:MAG: dTDP-4-dehydrorhamnose reductase [Rhodoferax sp.]|uniref:dTDP-4-dehydrorhamnose reductase n=1 Tax=Rhodoferax sp. TaxID=50421 RepID=UPI00272F04A0|nr:dTDP-4-dehydrorhamnose reductase [Rhodoferax sp.]MDP1531797.1 dTDP-4-dehydrorhamnose reductase [Rhodoferax sp.]MDP1944353.1 dTDP-4-dehydrorhamnose reductase [Rhodoferax sp.]